MFIFPDQELVQSAIAQITQQHGGTLPTSLIWAAAHEEVANQIRKACLESDRVQSGLSPLATDGLAIEG